MSAVTMVLVLSLPAQTATPPPAPELNRFVDTDPLCGVYCLYVALGALDLDLAPFAEFKESLGEPGAAGFSLGELAEHAERLGAHTLGVRTNTDNMRRRPERYACIAHLDRGHFVLLTDASDGAVTVVDPPRTSSIAPEMLATQWNGTALLISNTPLLAEEDLPHNVNWGWWVVGAGVLLVLVLAGWLFRKRPASA